MSVHLFQFRSRRLMTRFALSLALIVFLVSPLLADNVDQSMFGDLGWRSIGPATMGGRITDIAGVPGNPALFYVASASGGLFKTTNGGTTFAPIFENQPVLSIGAIALAPADPDVIYVGTGEGNVRNTASFGNGVYKSADGGKSWAWLGLGDTERFSRIRVHPKNPDVVYAAALGHEWGPNEERGLFVSRDGGRNWDKVLYVNETTGASDVILDPADPDIIYVGMYDYMRNAWVFRSGGPGSGLYRSKDGGKTWDELTAKAPDNGLPAGLLGRIGVGVAPSDPNVVYALIESEAPGELWRSDDRGLTWRMVSDNRDITYRPFYFSDLRVDTGDANRVYAVSGGLMVSDDGGENWERLGEGVHGDYQAMWIDPLNPNRVIVGSDGGAYLSFDRTETFRFLDNVVYSQVYHVQVDMRDPYYVCGGLQDNGVWCGPSNLWNTSGILNRDWYRIHGGDGYYAEIDPTDWTRIFANAHYGNIIRFDAKTGGQQSIQPYPVSLRGSAAGDHPYRFNWNSVIHMSPHDPQVVYFGGNVLFKTTDDGHSWTEISPDLTTNDSEKQQPSGGPITWDNTSAEYHCTIISVSESPVQAGVIWVGTDDGNVQVTRDGGKTWKNVVENIPDVPANMWVPTVDASNHEPATAYVVFDRHRDNDFSPRVFRTDDYGESWTDITSNLPDPGYPHVIRDDPKSPNLLYLGTELGIFASFDRGGRWVSLRQGLPPIAVRDLVVHPRDNDLIIGTHGRGFMVMDDVTPLQQLAEAVEKGMYLFDPPPATRVESWDDYTGVAQGNFVGDDAPIGTMISYYLSSDFTEGVSLEILDESGTPVRTLKTENATGINRLLWDMRSQPPGEAEEEEAGARRRRIGAPKVLPATYTVRLAAGGQQMTKTLALRLDPRLDIPREDLVAQHEATKRLIEMSLEGQEALERIENLRDETMSRMEKAPADLKAEGQSVCDRLDEVRKRLTADPGGYRSPAQIVDKIASLLRSIDSSPKRPTVAQSEWIGKFEKELEGVLGELEKVVTEDVARFNQRITTDGS
jgi:photosystem II stability/assembly factor-like uncharacterized protein